DRIAHRGEGGIGVGPERGDGGYAHHDNQGQHDGVLHRGGAIFLCDEVADELRAATEHDSSSPDRNTSETGLGRSGGPLHSAAWRSFLRRTHGFVSHPCGWFTFVLENPGGSRQRAD